jgi:hypothetical protein
LVSTSQPSEATALQSPRPAAQVMVHAPIAQPAAPPVALHARPQPPQWATAPLVSTSQPLAAAPSQSAKPALQVKPHAPAAQVGVALARAGHTVEQAPQLVALVARLTQRPPQLVSPAAHTSVHAPMEHTLPAGHAAGHAPQWAVSVLRFASQPFEAAPSQSPQPAAQLAMAHAPAVHAAVALARAHARPQAPQWDAAVLVFVSQPSLTSVLQLPRPAAQVMPHAPAAQLAAPPAVLHALVHAPQRAGSVLRFTSQPLAATPSQSA